MKAVFGLTLLCVLLAVAPRADAQCASMDSYTEEFIPQCAPQELNIEWPNYQNMATYYTCAGVGMPVLQTCPPNQWFTFVYQQCTYCSDYLPPVHCSQLKTQNPPNCVPMGSGSTSTAAPTTTSASSTPTPIQDTTTPAMTTEEGSTTETETTQTQTDTTETETETTTSEESGPTPPIILPPSGSVPTPPYIQ